MKMELEVELRWPVGGLHPILFLLGHGVHVGADPYDTGTKSIPEG